MVVSGRDSSNTTLVQRMKNRQKKNSYIILACFVAQIGFYQPVAAQTASTQEEAGSRVKFDNHVFGIGAQASLSTGMGLSFKHHLAGVPLAYQITGGGFKTDDVTMASYGIETQYDFSVSNVDRVYAAAGYGYYLWREDGRELEGPHRIAFGVGYERGYVGAVNISGSFLFTSFQPSGKLYPLPSIGIHYHFK
jgi:hypothetical protein